MHIPGWKIEWPQCQKYSSKPNANNQLLTEKNASQNPPKKVQKTWKQVSNGNTQTTRQKQGKTTANTIQTSAPNCHLGWTIFKKQSISIGHDQKQRTERRNEWKRKQRNIKSNLGYARKNIDQACKEHENSSQKLTLI